MKLNDKKKLESENEWEYLIQILCMVSCKALNLEAYQPVYFFMKNCTTIMFARQI